MDSRTDNEMQRVFQIAAWSLAFLIALLSVVPPSYRPVTAASHNLEHLAIYLSIGISFGAGYPVRPWIPAIGLASFCGVIEIAQLWAPGRHARLVDFLVDAAAACIGVGMACVALRLSSRGRADRVPRDGVARR